jgi:phospholipid/cholesterol/gamma-HCH transport system substrate-binding protein
MNIKSNENVKLGALVLAGLLLLVISLYLIGRNQNMFGAAFTMKARFRNVNGLMSGNNIRFAGIQAGTVSKVQVINDTTVEVTLLIDEDMRPFIRHNSVVTVGSEGLMGNRVVNINAGNTPGNPVEENQLLPSGSGPDTDEMLSVLSGTGNNLQTLSAGLVITINRLNNSRALWDLLDDAALPLTLKETMLHVRNASVHLEKLSADMSAITGQVRRGEGVAGALITDTVLAAQMKETIARINTASAQTVKLLAHADSLAVAAQKAATTQGGVVQSLGDTSLANDLRQSLQNVEEGTAGFKKIMEALQYNTIIKNAIKRQEKRKAGKKPTQNGK